MDTFWLVYFIGNIGKLEALFLGLAVVSAMGVFVFLMGADTSWGDSEQGCKFWAKICAVITIVFGLLCVFTPSSKTVAAMYLLPKIVENKEVQDIPEKLLKLTNGKLDKWIEDLNKTEGSTHE